MTSSNLQTAGDRADTTASRESVERPELLARYRWASQAVSGKAVLDAGAGSEEATRILVEAGAGRVAVTGDESSSFDVALCLDETASSDAVVRELHRALGPDGVAILALADEGTLDEIASTFATFARFEHSRQLVSTIARADHVASLDSGDPRPDEVMLLVVAAKGAIPELTGSAFAEEGIGANAMVKALDAALVDRDRALRQVERARTQEQHAAAERDRLAERLLDAEQAAAASARLEKEVREQVAIVNALKSTVSWRITKPIRWLRRLSGTRVRK